MARIRSVKPETFTSETLVQLPVAVRWTFVGLWTYVDDDGRGRDDTRLVKATVWPLDDEMTPRKIEHHLAALAEKGLICRYELGERRYLHVLNFREHQRINRPSESKIPECSVHAQGGLTEDSMKTQGAVTEGSLRARRNREQGTGNRDTPTAARAVARHDDPDSPATAQTLVAEWIDHVPKKPPGSVISQVGKHLKSMLEEGIDPADIRRGLASWANKGLHPSTLPSVVNEAMNSPPRTSSSNSTTDQRVRAGLELVEKYTRLESQQEPP